MATLKAQQEQLVAGIRHCQLFTHEELPLPPGMMRFENDDGVFHYDPRHVSHICPPYNLLLNLGPYSKEDLDHSDEPLIIVECTLDGVEVRAAAGTVKTAKEQFDYFVSSKSPGNIISIVPPAFLILHRMTKRKEEGLPIEGYI